MATEAYSVIEQGKVDVLLQSSPRDRRLIFEEAAGISRFKAKKLEALRRLERVEQNLLRLSDIVDEVESRLRAVRLQASKARRYKEYADRLQALRTQIGSADWRTLSARLAELEADLAAAGHENAVLSAQVESLEAQALALDVQVAEAETAARVSDERIAQNRERIAARESTMEHERRRARDLEAEVDRYRRQQVSMSVRAGDAEVQLRTIEQELVVAESEHREVARRLAEEERGLTKLNTQVDELRADHEQRRSAHLEKLRTRRGTRQRDQRFGVQGGSHGHGAAAWRQAACRVGRCPRDAVDRGRRLPPEAGGAGTGLPGTAIRAARSTAAACRKPQGRRGNSAASRAIARAPQRRQRAGRRAR